MREKIPGRRGRLFDKEPRAEVADELAFHLEQRVRDYMARGMDEPTARAAALERFGDVEQVRDECAGLLAADRRAEARRDWLDDLRQDLRFALRSAARAPLFTLLALLTLAVGIGANAAVFGVVKSVLLDALPYADAGRLVRVYGRLEDGSLERSSLSAGAIGDLAARQRSFASFAYFYHGTFETTYIRDGNPRVMTAAAVGAGYFSALGVAPRIGRAFTEADAATGAPAVVLLSHQAWLREFGGDPGVVGRTASFDGDATQIVGVLPRGYVGPMDEADVVAPLDLGPTLADPVRARKSHWLGMVGRLKPDVSANQAHRELVAIAADLQREHPDSHAGLTVQAVPLRDAMAGDTRTPLIVLMASAALVLLITCANLAGALLSRTLSRRKEFAVRVALGAERGRLVRQLLTESALLALAGGAAGLLLAAGGLSLLRGLAVSALPPYADLSLDGGAIAVTMGIALLTGVAFGVAPALSAGRQDPQGTLRDETRGTSESLRSRRLRGVLVAGQIALCVSLLAGAGLLARSLWAMTSAPLGFDPDGVLTAKVQIPPSGYEGVEAQIRFFEQLEERLRALPGVTAVASTSELPMPQMNRNGLEIQGVVWPASEQHFINYSSVSDDYFRLMRIPLLRGRAFGPTERPGSTPAIVINDAMAKRYWPKGDAVGARIHLGPNTDAQWAEVVGIVGDVRNDPALPRPEPMAYASRRQETYGSRVFLLRTTGDPLALTKPVERALRELDPRLPLRDVATLRAFLDEGLAGRRLPVLLMTAFGALALLLASVGVYSMFAAMAAARAREFGVRVALGSTPRAIAGLVLRQGGVWMGIGLAGGALGVVLVTGLLGDLLYGVPRFDPVAIGMAVLTLLACATVALLVPVRRAARVDPISILR
jgi:putative ABC transport system permease protein